MKKSPSFTRRANDLITERGCEETFEEFDAVLGLETLPKILETPKGKDGVVMDRKNLAFLRRLAEEKP